MDNSISIVGSRPGSNLLVRFAPLALTLMCVLAVVSLRNSTLFAHPQFWAEDAFVYFVEGRAFGANALLTQYSGYVQLVCRIIAYAVGFAPAEFAPRLYATLFLGSILLTAGLTFTSEIFMGWGKWLAAMVLVACPVDSEVFFGMCYTQWILAPVVALALYEQPKTRLRSAALLTCVALVGMSSPFVLIASPFAIWKVIRERTWFAFGLLATSCVVDVVQLQNILKRAAATPTNGTFFDRASTAATVLYRWATGAIYPGLVPAVIISALSAAFLAWFLWSSRTIALRPVIYFVGFGFALLMAGCLTLDPAISPNQFGAGGRYFYIPVVMIAWTLIIVEQSHARRRLTFYLSTIIFAALFYAHVTGVEGNYKAIDWGATVDCMKHGETCRVGLNPSVLGTSAIPSDHELQTMDNKALFDRFSAYSNRTN